jgi:hypothetical protein
LSGWFLARSRTPIESDRETVHPKDNATPADDPRQLDPVTFSQIPPAITQHSKADRRDDHTPPWKIFAEIAAISVGFGLLVVNIFLLCATKNAVNISQNTLKEMQTARQPWVGLETNNISVAPSPTFGPSTPQSPFFMIAENTAYSIKNYGTSPAIHESDVVMSIPDPCRVGASCVPPTEDLKTWCFAPEGISTHPGAANPGAGQMILPGAAIPIRKTSFLMLDPAKTQHIQRVWFFVCIAYQDPWEHMHHSRYWYLSTHPSDPYNGPQTPVPGHPGWTYVPISGLTLWGAEAD